jgi:hypothetical protein
MATVYIAPTAQGSGNGTNAANAYAYSSLSSAETDAGSGGTIFFLDGTYSSTDFSWDANGVSYKSLNLHGATIEGSGSLRILTLGHYSSSNVGLTLEGFEINNCRLRSYQAGSSSAKNTIKNNKFTATLASAVIIETQAQNTTDLINNTFNIDFDSGSSLSASYSIGTLNGNTFYIDIDSSVTSITSGFDGANIVGKNNIWVSTDSSKIGISLASSDSFSCFHNFGSSNTSGGTNNIFADPLFVDSANNDLRLRPSSPCINAGTAS